MPRAAGQQRGPQRAVIIDIAAQRGERGQAVCAVEHRQRKRDQRLVLFCGDLVEQGFAGLVVAEKRSVMDARFGGDFADRDLIERLGFEQVQQRRAQGCARLYRARIAAA